MLLKKEGFPEDDELVICTVTKVLPHSVFVNVDEYSKQGMIHISEVSPGRIRNIRDFVKESKKIVCKVLKTNQEKGYIDLSLRRVTETQKRKKIDDIKQEQVAEKIIEFAARDLKISVNKLFEDIVNSVLKKYVSLPDYFQQVVTDTSKINDAGLDEKASKKLEELIKLRIKKESVKLEGRLKLSSYAKNGLDVVKSALKKAENAGKEKASIKYLGGGFYNLVINANDYKEAEKLLKDTTETAIEFIKKNEGTGEFLRKESK